MIEIETLGNFNIKVNGTLVTDSLKKTTRLLQLLNLLIIYRNKSLPAVSICEMIWNEEQEFDTNKALHNLVYRLRNIIAGYGGPDIILFNNKSYKLNTSIDLQVDAYLMEDYYNKALSSKVKTDEKIELLQKAVDLYNGEYIFNTIYADTHSYAAANRYRNIFTDAVCILSDLYIVNDEYDKMFQICEKAIDLEPLEESVYLRFIRGLRNKGKDVQAINLIENYFEILYREMGMPPSETINKIYKELKNNAGYKTHDVERIMDELKEVSSLSKALFCNYESFKDIFRYEVRQLARRKYSLMVIIVEVNGGDDEELPEKTLSKAMRCLHECCILSLRRGDVFANYSKSHIIIMLTLPRETGANNILSRINNQFIDRVQHENIFLKFDVQATMPV